MPNQADPEVSHLPSRAMTRRADLCPEPLEPGVPVHVNPAASDPVPNVCRPVPSARTIKWTFNTMASISSLRYISPENLVALQSWPTPKIQTDADVEVWKQTQGYSDYSLFLRWLSDAVVGYSLPQMNDNQSEVPSNIREA